MFTLLSDIYHYCTLKEEYAVLMLGLDNAGKSTLLESLKHKFPAVKTDTDTALSSKLSRIRPTIGQSLAKLVIGGTNFVVWDLGGQSTLRDLWRRYYAESHVVVYVIDASTGERLRESLDVFQRLAHDLAGHVVPSSGDDAQSVEGQQEVGEQGEGAGGHEGVQVPILICANKQDVSGALSIAELKSQLSTLVSDIDPTEGGVLGCSALQGTGLDEIAEWIKTRALRNKDARPPKYR